MHLLMVVLIMIWTLDAVAISVGVRNIPEMALLCMKYLAALPVILLAAVSGRHLEKPKKKDLPMIFISAIVGNILYFGAEYTAILHLPISIDVKFHHVVCAEARHVGGAGVDDNAFLYRAGRGGSDHDVFAALQQLRAFAAPQQLRALRVPAAWRPALSRFPVSCGRRPPQDPCSFLALCYDTSSILYLYRSSSFRSICSVSSIFPPTITRNGHIPGHCH